MLLLFTHANPIGYPCIWVDTILHWNGAIREPILKSPIYLEYIAHMKGVDVANQLWASYNSQTQTINGGIAYFNFFLDMTIVLSITS